MSVGEYTDVHCTPGEHIQNDQFCGLASLVELVGCAPNPHFLDSWYRAIAPSQHWDIVTVGDVAGSHVTWTSRFNVKGTPGQCMVQAFRGSCWIQLVVEIRVAMIDIQ